MNKFLYTQDLHGAGINSRNRLGSYYSDWINKLKDIISIYKEQKCDLWIDGGDLYESDTVSNNIVDDVLDLFEENNINFVGLMGNHSLRYANFSASKGTSFYHMVKRSKNFNYLETIIKKDYIIKPIEYYHGVEEDLKKNGIIFDKEFDKHFKIAVVHAFVCEKEFPYATHITYKQLKTNADLVLVGHYHLPSEKKIKETTFLNIGCGGRRSVTEAYILPSCLIIDIEKRSWEKIGLQSAKSPEEGFDLTKIAEEKESDKNIDSFLEKIENFAFESINIRDRIKEFAKVTNESQEVLDNIIERQIKLEKKDE